MAFSILIAVVRFVDFFWLEFDEHMTDEWINLEKKSKQLENKDKSFLVYFHSGRSYKIDLHIPSTFKLSRFEMFFFCPLFYLLRNHISETRQIMSLMHDRGRS